MRAGLAWAGIILFGAFTLILARGKVPPQVPSPPPDLQLSTRAPSRIVPLSIRVCLTDAPVSSVTIAVESAFRVTPVGEKRTLMQSRNRTECTVEAVGTGFDFGDQHLPAKQLEIVPEKSPSVWVNGHQYRGVVRLYQQPNGRIIPVNILPLEDYVASVLDSEMPADFPQAARQAQAIVARTFAIYQMQQSQQHPHFDLYASTRSQKYLGVQYRDSRGRRLAAESDSSRKAALDTAHWVCTYQGKVFGTYYTAVCGGRTTTGREVFSDAVPALVSVPCEWCRESPRYRWKAEISRDRLHDLLDSHFAKKNQPFHELNAIRISSSSRPDGIPVVEVKDGRRMRSLSAADIRNALPPLTLPSPHFTVRMTGETVQFEGRGHGHGVGFCQWGARGQALAGRSAHDIVRSYYPGAEIAPLVPASR